VQPKRITKKTRKQVNAKTEVNLRIKPKRQFGYLIITFNKSFFIPEKCFISCGVMRLIFVLFALFLIFGCTSPQAPVLLRDNYESDSFGLHAITGIEDKAPILISNLDADARLIIRYEGFVKSKTSGELMKTIDEEYSSLFDLSNDFVITLVSGNRIGNTFEFIALEGEEETEWVNFVGKLVERYDGDEDYGCDVVAPDCFAAGDKTYPSKEIIEMIKSKPIKHWQIDNEWFMQLKDKETNEVPSKEKLLAHLKDVSTAVKKSDASAKVILGAITANEIQALNAYDGSEKFNFVETGNDCTYQKTYLAEAPDQFKQMLALSKERFEYILTQGADYYDIIDFHYYQNYPEVIEEEINYINSILSDRNISEKKIWLLEAAGPFYFFPLLGEKKPSAQNSNCTEPYDAQMHAEHLVKIHAIAFASGAEKVFYSSLLPTLGWSDNFVRLSLLDEKGKPKPAYYAYAQVRYKLGGFIQAEKISDGIYKFSFKDNKPLFIAWSEEEKYSDFSFIGKNVKIISIALSADKNGHLIAQTFIVNSAMVQLTKSPVFIEEE